MYLILCHMTADFDTVGAAVGLTRLHPGAKIVLTGGCHPAVQDFLALHRDEYPLIERRSVNPSQIQALAVVDTQFCDRVGKAAEWLTQSGVDIVVYDHHPGVTSDIPATERHIEAVGSTTTMIVEQLRAEQIELTGAEATVMALGIHVDTGSLTYAQSTARDAIALAWLMQQGASLRAIADYVEPGLSSSLQDILSAALEQIQTENHQGYCLAWVVVNTESYTPGLSSVTSRLMDLTDSDTLLFCNQYGADAEGGAARLTIIGRSRSHPFGTGTDQGIDLAAIFQPWGGGGHPAAAAVTLRQENLDQVVQQVLAEVRSQIPKPPTARELMSSPVRTIRPSTTIAEAQRILLRYGHSGLSVVDREDNLVGVISRRDLDIALHHGFSHAPVKGYMTTNLKTITPDTLLPDIESLMVTYDVGRLPVLDRDNLVGIVTRTDVLRQLHQEKALSERPHQSEDNLTYCPMPQTIQRRLRQALVVELWEILMAAAEAAEQQGWHLYVVGGAVRDILLTASDDPPLLEDVDLVVDGFHRAAQAGAGVELAKVLQERYPESRLQVHGRFQTAALIWHKHPVLGSLMIDIATARTEFYPYPAANPEVEASSIRQDLYRRDFTVNAMAIRLTQPRQGELLDFFGGLIDLQHQQIRVLHTNSFIEDPTRIYRAVRFAVRLGFTIEPQTERYIRHAIDSGIYRQIQTQLDKAPALQTRLKNELKYILQASYWKPAIRLLADLGALQCIHSSLTFEHTALEDSPLWWHLRLMDRWLRRFDPDCALNHWEMLLEVLMAHIEPGDRVQVATNLQLPQDGIERLAQLEDCVTSFTDTLPTLSCASQKAAVLRSHSRETLILVGIFVPRSVRRIIWRYLTHWSQVKPVLDGSDLKQLGYKPGPQFKTMLDDLQAATLDQQVQTAAEAEAYLADHYPLADKKSDQPQKLSSNQ